MILPVWNCKASIYLNNVIAIARFNSYQDGEVSVALI